MKIFKQNIQMLFDISKKHHLKFSFYLWLIFSIKILYTFWRIYIVIIFIVYFKALLIFVEKKAYFKINGKISLLYCYTLLNILSLPQSINKLRTESIIYLVSMFSFRIIVGYPFNFIKVLICFYETVHTLYKEDNIPMKKIHVLKYTTLLKKSYEHVLMTHIIKKKNIEEKSTISILNRSIAIGIEITKYSDVEFAIYDYPMKSEMLNNYKVEYVSVSHQKNAIYIQCKKEDLYFAINIFLCKFSVIDYPDIVKTYLITDDGEMIIAQSYEEIYEKCIKLKSHVFTLAIKSDIYDLRNENGMIVYYNSSYLYNNSVLDKILEQF